MLTNNNSAENLNNNVDLFARNRSSVIDASSDESDCMCLLFFLLFTY